MLYKNTLMKIKGSLGRYFSLFIIILFGVGVYAGLVGSGPNILSTVNHFYQNYQLLDLDITSNLGLVDEDVAALQGVPGVKQVIPTFTLDVLVDGTGIRLHAIEDDINGFGLLEGSFPDKEEEALADAKQYRVGDKIKITSDVSEQLKNDTFTVVGTIHSPQYMAIDYGSTTVGDGTLHSFLYILKENFILGAYTNVYIKAQGGYEAGAYTEEYDDIINQLKNDLKVIQKERETKRYEEIVGKVDDKIQEAKDEVGKIRPAKWYIRDRDSVIGYSELKFSTDAINSVVVVFPVFLILIVILMTSNTMARMIVEERGEFGTLSSLGYSNGSIITTYLLYVLSATVIGSLLGFFLGSSTIPRIIYSAFYQFILPDLEVNLNIIHLIFITGMAILLMTCVTVFFCYMELRQNPATLMRPIPPKNGQTIFLERVDYIWNHLSFTRKVTIRNIFRYKQRVLMTIIGVSGCVALLLTGFGIKDSINGVASEQYGEIFRYRGMLILEEDTENLTEELKNSLTNGKVENPLLIRQSTVEAFHNQKEVEAFMVIPENDETFKQYFNLTNIKSEEEIQLSDDGVIITEKLAQVLKKEKGDTLTITGDDNLTYSLVISKVAKHYIKNYIYISKSYYQQVFADNPTYNMIVCDYDGVEDTLAKALLEDGKIINVTFIKDIIQAAEEGNSSLNSVVVMIVIIALLLVIIVLYNLTSINISERKREIATLKVLGFTDLESNQYIYREAIILTFISTGIGLFLGILLHRFILAIIEGDMNVYYKEIKMMSYLYTILIVIGVNFVMQLITNLKTKTIDMIESLKSIE